MYMRYRNFIIIIIIITIPGYSHAFRNREKIKGGGVGVYLKESIKFKRHKDNDSRHPLMEHLWIEVPGRNKNSKLLIGTIYQRIRRTIWIGCNI